MFSFHFYLLRRNKAPVLNIDRTRLLAFSRAEWWTLNTLPRGLALMSEPPGRPRLFLRVLSGPLCTFVQILAWLPFSCSPFYLLFCAFPSLCLLLFLLFFFFKLPCLFVKYGWIHLFCLHSMNVFKCTANSKDFYSKYLPTYFVESRFYYICFITYLSIWPSFSQSCFWCISK